MFLPVKRLHSFFDLAHLGQPIENILMTLHEYLTGLNLLWDSRIFLNGRCGFRATFGKRRAVQPSIFFQMKESIFDPTDSLFRHCSSDADQRSANRR
jgi:hypothetical protein